MPEKQDIDLPMKRCIADLIATSRVDPQILKHTAKKFGWDRAYAVLVGSVLPKKPNARTGQFGEVLSAAALEEFLEYKIPLPKLRLLITGDQSLPGTDTIAIKKTAGQIEVCYAEFKTRISRDSRAALDSYEQLSKDYSSMVPQMIRFLYLWLSSTSDPLSDDFGNYLFERSVGTDRDSFRIILVHDNDTWTDTVLQNLEDYTVAKSPKVVIDIIKIRNLSALIDEVFALAKVVGIPD